MVYIGIDPGVSGGICAVRETGQLFLCAKMPETERDIYDLIAQLPMNRGFFDGQRFAVLERVWSSPGWGHVGAFKFGLSYGSLRMALTAAGIPFEEVLPRAWQKEMGVSYPADIDATAKKNITKRRAQALFPGHTLTHATADAALMAEYARRTFPRTQHGQEGSRQEEGGKASRETETPAIAQGGGKGHARRQSAQG